MERTDTRPMGIPAGKYMMAVSAVPESGEWGPGKNYYEFNFMAQVGDRMQKHNERIPVWKCADLLRAIGCKETEPDVFEWEKEEVVGTMFNGELAYEEFKRKDGTMSKNLKLKTATKIEGFPKTKLLNDEEVPF